MTRAFFMRFFYDNKIAFSSFDELYIEIVIKNKVEN